MDDEDRKKGGEIVSSSSTSGEERLLSRISKRNIIEGSSDRDTWMEFVPVIFELPLIDQ